MPVVASALAKNKKKTTTPQAVVQSISVDEGDTDGDGVLTEEEKIAFAEKARRDPATTARTSLTPFRGSRGRKRARGG